MIKRGDINQSSFGFTVAEDSWAKRDGTTYRTIKRVKEMYDVGPVTFPAYPEASVAVRKLEEINLEENRTFENDPATLEVKAALYFHQA